MSLFIMVAVVFLAGFHRDSEPVLPGGQGTGGVRCECTGRVVGPIEVEDYLAVFRRIRHQETPGRVGAVA